LLVPSVLLQARWNAVDGGIKIQHSGIIFNISKFDKDQKQ